MEQLEIFFNTIGEKGDTLRQLQIHAGTQNALILEYFKERPMGSYTPHEVKANCSQLWHTPITSVRRAITTLTDYGYLYVTGEMKPGPYGVKSHCWKYKSE